MKSICVFCGSSPGQGDEYLNAARQLGALLARRGITLIYGGGSVGLMGAIANATLRAGGKAVGVIPKFLWDQEVGHRALTDLHIVETMHERKALMAELSDTFITLPGGIGTLEEFFEVWTWGQLGIHNKPFGVLDVGGFYSGLFGMLDHMTQQGFLKAKHREMVRVSADAKELLKALAEYQPPETETWVDLARA